MDSNSISRDSSSYCGCPQLPPGFRFHPTDEELVVHYLKRKAASAPLPVAIIADIDLYKFDPWELPSKAAFGDEEWYFFSPRERKYPNGARPNRAATSGYWKATGTDKPILSSDGLHHKLGVKKALVFYGGKPPKGVKTNWIMHEYRLTHPHKLIPPSPSPSPSSTSSNKNNSSLRLDNWVLCRIYKKCNTSNMIQNSLQHQRPPLMEKEVSMEEAMLPFISPTTLSMPNNAISINDDDNLLEYGMLGAGGADHSHQSHHHDMDNSESSSQGRGMINSSLFPAMKRPLASAFWNVDTSTGSSISGSSSSSKRMLFHGDLNDGNGNDAINTTVGDDDNTSFVSLLRQLPPSHIHDHEANNNNGNHNGLVGSLSSTVLRHQFQLPTLNWNS